MGDYGLTVRELRAKLAKFPANALVGWADQDQDENELNARVRTVEEASDHIKGERGVHVVLRP